MRLIGCSGNMTATRLSFDLSRMLYGHRDHCNQGPGTWCHQKDLPWSSALVSKMRRQQEPLHGQHGSETRIGDASNLKFLKPLAQSPLASCQT